MRVHVVVSGLVQGVGFRYATAREGRRLGLSGWARNTPDGRVEIVAEGEAQAVRQFAEWCRSGPPGARVRTVEEREVAGEFRLVDFDVRW